MKKILLIDDAFHREGKGAFLFVSQKKYLKDLGYDVYTMSFPNPGVDYSMKDENDYVFTEKAGRIASRLHKFTSHSAVEKFTKEVLDEVQPDVIHVHMLAKYPSSVYKAIPAHIRVVQTLHGPNFFCTTGWGCLKKTSGPCEMGIGLKCTLRGCAPLVNTLLYSNLTRQLMPELREKVDVFHCPSRNILKTATRMGFQNVEYIPLGINETFLEVPETLPEKHADPTVLFVGTYDECKGVDVLIEAFVEVVKVLPNAKLNLAGRGPRVPFYEAKAQSLGVGESVNFLGFVPHADLKLEYYKSHAFCLPSLWQEQFGLVGPEAMACGLPTIGSDIGGIREWIQHGDTGYLVPPKSAPQLAKAIVKLLSDPEKAVAMGQTAKTFALAKHNHQAYLGSLTDLLKG